jgi:hypothetical protein
MDVSNTHTNSNTFSEWLFQFTFVALKKARYVGNNPLNLLFCFCHHHFIGEIVVLLSSTKLENMINKERRKKMCITFFQKLTVVFTQLLLRKECCLLKKMVPYASWSATNSKTFQGVLQSQDIVKMACQGCRKFLEVIVDFLWCAF